MSPRKSSTSSGNRFDRPRYLLVEVVGVPTLSPRALEDQLAARLGARSLGGLRFRVIRVDGRYGLVAVAHTDAGRARDAWNPVPGGALRTLRTFGTLRKGKAWLARSRPPARRVAPGSAR